MNPYDRRACSNKMFECAAGHLVVSVSDWLVGGGLCLGGEVLA
jgi:hypothetical protein